LALFFDSANDLSQMFGRKRLLQIIKRTTLHRGNGGGDRGVRREHNNRHLWVLPFNVFQNFEPIFIAESQIEKRKVVSIFVKLQDSHLAPVSRVRLVTRSLNRDHRRNAD
jgi:hypothetical protein